MIDISLNLSRDLITYPGDLCFESYEYKTHPRDQVHITRLLLETHSGTHFDAPFHAMPDGVTSAHVPLENFIGECTVCEVSGNSVKASDLPSRHKKRILFKTKNSELYETGKFETDFCYVAEDAARELVKRGVALVGIDYLSIEQFGTKGMKVHKIILSSGASILEGIDLRGVSPGDYDLLCLPLKLDTDGAPCRAILR
ncbi:MAG: cyclase family protein [Thermoplasmataceae archaeon]|jgi:arylformamidase